MPTVPMVTQHPMPNPYEMTGEVTHAGERGKRDTPAKRYPSCLTGHRYRGFKSHLFLVLSQLKLELQRHLPLNFSLKKTFRHPSTAADASVDCSPFKTH